ncbi:NUDIX hydrolase [Aestuariivirga sp.]|uniref:NUDIX hydrolase n=1 Tax=Aestuariivirga sp. TaxID=2650926 RepID=UPI0035943E3E
MIRIELVTSLDLRCLDGGWDFSHRNREAIDRHWQGIATEKPALWNGQVLLCTGATAANGHFAATFTETDYASFVAWRDWGRPDASVCNCFGVAAAFSSDGAMVLGVMGGWTLNAGKAYPPSGTLEPKDVRPDGTVDLFGNMRTELLEETGLDLHHSTVGDMVAIFEGPRLAIARRHDFALSFAEMEKRFAELSASEENPELAAIEPVRAASQIDSRMPPYAAEIIRYFISST